MHILILGGTGFVGRRLAADLTQTGHSVSVASRRAGSPAANPRRVVWNGSDAAALADLLEGVDALINLQGENIGGGRWTPERRQAIVGSRVAAGRALCGALRLRTEQSRSLPGTLLQASATGYYGLWRHSAPPRDESAPAGQGFLAETCTQWEESTAQVEAMPPAILQLSKRFLRDPEILAIAQKTLTVPAIEQVYYEVRPHQKMDALCRVLDAQGFRKALVFCSTKRSVDEVTAHLQQRGYQSDGLHGDLAQSQRDRVMQRFRGEGLDILIATDVAARGIDVDDVDAVVNYDIPHAG